MWHGKSDKGFDVTATHLIPKVWTLITHPLIMQKARKGIKITITHLIIKAVASAVRQIRRPFHCMSIRQSQ